ncbi:circadian associated repressor of transcription a [Siniperca chuatsi]|uniref:circadian associated repressor of transcription a n=1 Tax=Siniperca chuatsi TaxID=119488 RepID=UPI001CE1A4D4|nr:circadian associated repressor of transcription a [Siniperca chuatsi]XP_044027471.1 circadian associated repressor of transcription a [Siniperca chuatsi]
MNSLGSSSKWPSYDSLPSTSSFLLSESEQTEDEADVFSEGEGDSGIRNSLSVDEGITLSRNYLDFPAHSDQLHLRLSKSDQPEQCPGETKHPDSASSPGAATLGSSSATPGDLAFAQKCTDLCRFIRPLLELLQGLKTGRFDKGLSSFQQSVAIDRLQRILGILQRPEMGEKYLQNLLQIEMLLKMWFPQVAFQSTDAPKQITTPRLPPHWRQNQLHMPVKKRKLSWSDPDYSGKVPTEHKRHQHGKHGSCQAAGSLDTVSTCLPGSPKKQKTPEEENVELAGGRCTAGHEFTDSTDTLSRPSYLCSKRENEKWKQPEISLPSPCGSPAAQDSSVSSSDTITTTDSP